MSQFKSKLVSLGDSDDGDCGGGDGGKGGAGGEGIDGIDVVVCVFKFLVVRMMDWCSMFTSAPSAGSTSIEVKIPTKPRQGSTFL